MPNHVIVSKPIHVNGKVVTSWPTLKGLFKQMLGSFRFVSEELKWVDRIKPDVLIVRPDQIFSYLVTSRLRKLPLVLECDGPVEELDQHWGLNSRWVRPFDTWRAHRAEALTYISEPCGEVWREKKIPPGKMFYLPNGAHPDKWQPLQPEVRLALRDKYGLTGCKVIGFSGNLRSWHGIDLLISAAIPLMEKDPTIKIFFIGAIDDPDFLAKQKAPQHLREKQFVFTGPLAYPTMGDHIDLADCIVIPYPFHDFFYFSPMKLFEAMCLGKLIVAPRLGQIEELLGELQSPLLYDPRVPGALAQNLERAIEHISHNPEGTVLGVDARASIIKSHTWAHRGKTMVEACDYAVQVATKTKVRQ